MAVHDAIVWSPLHERGLAHERPAHDGTHTAIAYDRVLEQRGAAAPWSARVRPDERGEAPTSTSLVQWMFEEAERYVSAHVPVALRARIGLALGTSSGGMDAAQRCFERLAGDGLWSCPTALYSGPTASSSRALGFEPATQLFAACASSSLAIGAASRWIERGACDVALAGGYDVVSEFVHAGFEALRAVASDGVVQPFDQGRHGMVLGEGFGLVVLAREGALARPVRAYVAGFGASADAHHVTAPEPTGAGLARAIERATAASAAQPGDVVSAHGTATPYNDAAELAALARASWRDAPLFASKSVIGHTLGAAGVLETALALEAAHAGVVPATAATPAPLEGANVSVQPRLGPVRRVLKLACAFGGQNAALLYEVAGRGPGSPERPRPPPRAVYLSPGTAAFASLSVEELARRFERPVDKVARADALVQLALSAAAPLAVEGGDRTGVIVGHGLATTETNSRFWKHIMKHGVTRAEPRRFPYTSPNIVAGELSLALRATGPSFAVGGGPHGGVEAVAMACELVAAGDADAVLVVAVDEVASVARALAPDSRGGAVACVVRAAAAPAGVASWRTGLAAAARIAAIPRSMSCHEGLLPLVGGAPDALMAEAPWGAFAHVDLNWAK